MISIIGGSFTWKTKYFFYKIKCFRGLKCFFCKKHKYVCIYVYLLHVYINIYIIKIFIVIFIKYNKVNPIAMKFAEQYKVS